MNLLDLLNYIYLDDTEWAGNPHEVFVVGGYMQIFCSVVALSTALVVLYEIRTGPWFIKRVIIAIIVVGISIIIVQVGIILNAFSTNITNAIGIFFFCLYTLLDIEIYWTFAIRYWETSFHITSYLRRQAADDNEYKQLMAKQKRRQKCLTYLRWVFSFLAIITVFGWGITDAIIEFYDKDTGKRGFMEKYLKQDQRSILFGCCNYLWLSLRFLSIVFFANALCRFWNVFREVNDDMTDQNRGGFYVHLVLVVVYFLAMGFIADFFIISGTEGKFYSRLWLWSFMLATMVGFANYILIIVVAREMFVYYELE